MTSLAGLRNTGDEMCECIYCGDGNATSVSHIIPESLGNNTTLNRGVCGGCNLAINREVEEPVIRSFSVLRSFFEIEGKRDERPTISIEARYGTGRHRFLARSALDVFSRVFVFKDFSDPQGVARKIAFLSFDQKAISEHRERYNPRHTDSPLNEIPRDNLEGLEFWVDFDFTTLSDPRCLRMIAKIAFEWWCLERSPEFVSSGDYDDIRRYIRNGTDVNPPLVSVIDDLRVDAYLGAVPFGPHLLYRHTNRRLNNLVMVVSPFSLIYYQVVLSRNYRPLAADSMMTSINPQTGEAYQPKIENPRGGVLILNGAVPANWADARVVVGRISPRLLIRLNQGMKKIIDDSDQNACGADSN